MDNKKSDMPLPDTDVDAETRMKQQSPNDPSKKMKDGTNDNLDEDLQDDEEGNRGDTSVGDTDEEESGRENDERNSVQEDLPSDEQTPNPSVEGKR